MTRVLMTADTVGGVWTYAVELTAALAPFGMEVHLATMGRLPSADQRASAAAAGVTAVHESEFALEWMPEPWDDVDAAGHWLLQLAHEVDADVVHLNGFAHGSLPWPAPAVVVAHSCVLSWWHAVHGTPAPREWDTYRRRVTAGLAAADAVVAPTAAMLRELRRWYGTTAGTVVSNAVRPSAARAPAPKQPLVLGAGRIWDEAKNLQRLVNVAPRLAWPVAVAGDAAAGGALEGSTDGAARLLGRLSREELQSWLARASVFVAPSSYEPFGLGPLEAAQAGCALVLGDVASLREVWGDAALYVDPRDDDALVATVARLVDDADLLRALAARARERAQRYTPAVMASAYRRVYAGLPPVAERAGVGVHAGVGG